MAEQVKVLQAAANAATSAVPVERPRLTPHNPLWRDFAEIVVLIATIYTLVNLATARAVVEGSSMQPNFHTGQLVIVNRFAYFASKPERGDVIVLHNPRDPSEDFIKRVMALPGETIQIIEGRVFINGTMLEEPYIENFCKTNCDGTWTLKDNEYFVLGDNRGNSHDSHAFGPIDQRLIVGQAWIRYYPLSEFAIINHPDYAPIASTYTPAPVTPTPTARPIPQQLPGGEQGVSGARFQGPN